MDTANGDSLLKQLQVAEEGTVLFPVFQTATMTCLSLQGYKHYVTAQHLFGSGSTKLFIRVFFGLQNTYRLQRNYSSCWMRLEKV